MARTITPKQKKFADKYIETGNGSLSAKEAYDITTDGSARAVASETLTKPNVIEYLANHADMAVKEVVRIMQHGESDEVRLRASKDILDRAGFKPIEKSQSVNVNIEVEQTDELLALAKEINDRHRTTSERSNGTTPSSMGNEVQDKE